MKKWIFLWILLILCFNAVAVAAPGVKTERVQVPLELAGKMYLLDAIIYKPEGEGPFPAMVITHGTPRLAADRAKTTADTYYVRQSEAQSFHFRRIAAVSGSSYVRAQ